MVRDQALAVSGLLVEKIGGPSVKPYQPPGLWKELAGGDDYKPDTGEGLHRRSLYTFWKRTAPPPMMMNFDAAGRETCVVREMRTNTPLQALEPDERRDVLEAARALAERMMREGGDARGSASLMVSRWPRRGRPSRGRARSCWPACAIIGTHSRPIRAPRRSTLVQEDAPRLPKLRRPASWRPIRRSRA